jgi:CO/xanthine dehydrogenase Mo-binding subunit
VASDASSAWPALRLGDRHAEHGDTASTPQGIGTLGSRSLAVGGAALVRATTKVRDKARRIAAHILEAAPEDVVLAEGRYQVKGAPDTALTLNQIARRAYSGGLPDDIDPGLEATDFFRPPSWSTHSAPTSQWSRSIPRPVSFACATISQ